MNPVSFFFNLIDVGVNFLLSSFLQVIVTTAIVFRYLWIIDPPPPSSGQATPITAGPNNHPNGPEPAHESTTDDPTDG